MKGHLTHEHVDSHMDRVRLWHQLSLEQQLNCLCDNLAKMAVAHSIHQGLRHPGKQLLPCEDAAVYVEGRKATSNFA